MKRIFAFVLALTMLAALPLDGSALATPKLEIEKNDKTKGEITLKLQLENEFAYAPVLVRVINTDKGEGLADMVWAEQVRADKAGLVRLTLNTAGYDTGDYIFAADVDGRTASLKTDPALRIYSAGEKEEIWKRIQKKTEADLEWVVENRGEYLELDTATYNALGTQKAQFLKNCLDCTYSSLDDFVKKFNINTALCGFIGATDDAAHTLATDIFKRLATESTTAVKAYGENAQLKAAAINALVTNATTLTADNFKLTFETAVVLKELEQNTDLWTAYESVLKKYSAEIEIDDTLTEYAKKTDQANIINQMTAANDSFKALTDVKSKFVALVTNAPDAGDTTTTTTTPTGGGGGGGVKKPTTAAGSNAENTAGTGTSATGFNDTHATPWAEEAIKYLADRGVINGRGDGSFAPNDYVTRAELVKLLICAFNIDLQTAEAVFADVNIGDWYAAYVTTAFKKGIVNGLTEASFAPNEPVTRQDLCVMAARLAQNAESAGTLSFADNAEIADYARSAILYMTANGIVNGMDNNRFCPTECATRAQAAKILYGMIKTGV